MKPIKTPEQHAEALSCLDSLFSRGESLTQEQRDELEILATLIEKYERDTYPVASPTPLEAIKFRMEQMGYKQKDLAGLVGGASRASEIMTGKRGLTTEMIRRLRDEWGIPADSLLGGATPDPDPSAPTPGADGAYDPDNYPLKQMYGRGYFPKYSNDWKGHRKDPAGLLRDLYPHGSGVRRELAHCRQGGGENAKANRHALDAWQHRVLVRAAEKKNLPAYDRAALDGNFLRWLAGLSVLTDGPRLACEALAEKGIAMVIEPHLEQTYLDGAALLGSDDRPVIGLTLRHNRLDNFWFTLFHEIGHVLFHLSPENPVILDVDIDRRKTDVVETEADRFALDTLIPPGAWDEQVRHLHLAAEIRAAAKRLCVHPAVIAGRLRREANDYRMHRTLVGYNEVKTVFGITEEN